MEPAQIIKHPLSTEKSIRMMESENKLLFVVDMKANKSEIKNAIEKLNKLKFESPNLSINAPHFVFYIRDLIEKEFGSKILDEGIRVKTTLSLEAQQNAEKIKI